MLEKPDLSDEKIITCLENEYGLLIEQVNFLPLGADQYSAVYRAIARDGNSYFVKLRSGEFNEMAVEITKYLSAQGINQIIAPFLTRNDRLWISLETFKLVFYPFITGRNGYEVELSDEQWVEFGTAIKNIHSTALPVGLAKNISEETFPNKWCEIVKIFMEKVGVSFFDDPIARKTAVFLYGKRAEISDIIGRTEHLATIIQTQPLEFLLCHGDLHAGNILIEADGAIKIVDWDNLILAPKERDLMFIGGGQGFKGHSRDEEEALFYRGYGKTAINQNVLAYYRYERIIEDIAIYGEQLLFSIEGGDDREQSFRFLCSNFLPNNTIEIAIRSDKSGSTGK